MWVVIVHCHSYAAWTVIDNETIVRHVNAFSDIGFWSSKSDIVRYKKYQSVADPDP